MHNSLRGELTLFFDTQAIVLRPTFDALARLESATDFSLIALARRMAAGEATLAQLHAIIATCALQPPSDLEAQLAGCGSLKLHELLLPFLIGAITGEPHADA